MPAVITPVTTLMVGGLVVLAASAGSGMLLIAVVAAQALVAYGLLSTGGLVDVSRDGALVVLAGAAGAVALAVDENPAGLTPSLGPVAYALGPAVLIALMLRLFGSARRDHLVEDFASTVTGVALVGMLAVLVESGTLEDGADLVMLVVTCAVVAALPGLAAPAGRPALWVWCLAKVAALLAAGGLAAVDLFGIHASLRYAVGGAASIAGALGAEIAVRLGATSVARAALVPAVAISLAGPPAYVLARMLVG